MIIYSELKISAKHVFVTVAVSDKFGKKFATNSKSV